MGHFGKWPIRVAWFGLVLPALVLNYFGQGALLIANPTALDNPFYHAFPGWALYPWSASPRRTIIASQATITGTYSLTRQRDQLGFLPRMNIIQTSARQYGQIYIPAINWVLLRWCCGGVRLRLVERARFGLWRCGHRHDDRHDDPHVLRHPLRLGAIRCGCASSPPASSS